jgi:hypothetical protein
VHRNIISVEFMGFNVVKPRCAIPIGRPCVPLEGPSRRLGASARALDQDLDDVDIPFDIQLFQKEQLIVRISRCVCGCG